MRILDKWNRKKRDLCWQQQLDKNKFVSCGLVMGYILVFISNLLLR